PVPVNGRRPRATRARPIASPHEGATQMPAQALETTRPDHRVVAKGNALSLLDHSKNSPTPPPSRSPARTPTPSALRSSLTNTRSYWSSALLRPGTVGRTTARTRVLPS